MAKFVEANSREAYLNTTVSDLLDGMKEHKADSVCHAWEDPLLGKVTLVLTNDQSAAQVLYNWAERNIR